jgi:hypothetical protein
MKSIFRICAALVVIRLIFFVTPGTALANPDKFPEPDPPRREIEADSRNPLYMEPYLSVHRAVSPAVEWTYHKTPDSRHPDNNEQQMLWLMNRARSNPTAEGIWLATIYDRYTSYAPGCGQLDDDVDFCYIAAALDYWRVDLELMQNEFAAYDAKAPAAFDVRLYRAAKAHSDYLIGIDDQNHTNQFARIDDQNFSYIRARGNVFSYSLSAAYGHAAFNVDWGPPHPEDDPTASGMQPGRGHRLAIMSIDGDYTNVGIAAVPEAKPDTSVGPLVITGNYCQANINAADHFNRFIVGTVWTDKDGDDFFDRGEGLGNVKVTPDQGTYYAITSVAGGYAIPVSEPGTYEVTFSGSALSGSAAEGGFVKTVEIGDESVLLDFISDQGSTSASSDDGDDDDKGGGGGGGGGCFIGVIPVDASASTALRIAIFFGSVVLIGSARIGNREQLKN